MDYARKIGKSKDTKKWLEKRVTMVTTTDGPLINDIPYDEYIEDKRLKNWKKWINEREKISNRIKSLTGRSRIDQILNSCEKVRSMIEMKNFMEYATTQQDCHEFWKIPKSLPNHGDPNLPEITMTLTKSDLKIQSDLTYVDVPLLIEQEKGLHGISLKETNWEHNSYFKQRQEELKDDIETLIPKKPETKELLIRGKRFEETTKFIKIPVITVTEPEDDEYIEPDSTIILKIQDREIVQKSLNDRCNDKPIEWNFIFHGTINRRSEKMIIFENKGNTVIHYHWRDSSFKSNLRSYFKHRTSPFYFNKTDGIILQGKIIKLMIYYLPRSSNVFTESWRLFTDPKLCDCPLIFRFWACAEETIDERVLDYSKISKIDFYLNLRIRDSIIREIIDDIIADVDYKKPPEPAYASLFYEYDIFQSKNPYYYYHTNLILEFRQIYCEVVEKPAITWNLSLNDLRGILLLITNSKLRERMLLRFHYLCKESLKPSLVSYSTMNDRKNITVYNLLCSFVNRFELESELVKNNCILIKKENELSKKDISSKLELSDKSVTKNRKKNKKRNNDSTYEEISESSISFIQEDYYFKDQFYMEIFFIRIREYFVEIIDRISAIIDSYNRLDGLL
ncbi:hypothetical protein M0802_006537 [Mischocyttarus mexicanus]|nr:hypothetical protein M0802_006537 [Mischocyttarus mexicanus]